MFFNKLLMSKYWIAIQHNIEDDHYVAPLGIFSKKKYAIERVMQLINDIGFESGDEKSGLFFV